MTATNRPLDRDASSVGAAGGRTTTDPTGATFEASPLQQRLWQLRHSGRPAPYVQARVALAGPVDRAALAAAVERSVARHEILRTTLHSGPDGRGAQLVHDTGPQLRVAGDATSVEEACAAERAALDPVTGPAFGALLVDSAGELVLTAHAAIADAASLRLLGDQLTAALDPAPALDGASADRTAEPLAYADFASWHRDLLVTDDGAADRRAWAGRVAELDQAGTPAAPLGEPVTVVRVLPEDLVAGVDALAGAHGVPTGRLVAAGYAAVCQRMQGGRDIVLGLAEPARGYDSVREAIGPFARTLPVLCGFDPDGSLGAAAARLDAQRAQWAERIDYLDPAAERDGWYGFEYTEDEVETGSTELVRLSAVRRDGRLTLRLRFAGDPAPAESVLDSVEALLRDAVRRPETPVAALDAVPAGQRDRLLARGRGPQAAGAGVPVHEAVAGWAASRPDAVAVSCGDRELTYADLDRRANQLAHYLESTGVRPGDRVVISLDHSVELLVAILGVVKAGAAFVPVDPAHPRERLTHVLADTNAAMLLCTARRRAGLLISTPMLVDDEWPRLADLPGTPPGVTVAPTDTAYVLYTSGTTGTPNGVLIPHRGLANYLAWCAAAYDLAAGTGALVHSSIGFDFTLTALLGPLLVGNRVVMLPEAGNVAGLAAALRAHRDLSLVKLTPTHLDVLGQLLVAEDLAGAVRTVVVGGEALDARAVAPFRAAGARVVNEYGPTETVVGSTAYVVGEADPATGPVPIGRPIAATRVYLCDARGALLPDGAVGEICIGGAGVADGYLNRPELTAQRFVAEPGDPAGRMYRTGDLGRWRPDGGLDYLGRLDDQIKIHGVRAEPAEIEAVLLGIEGIAQAVVVVRRDDDPGRSSPLAGIPTLVAYLVPAHGDVPPGHARLAQLCRAQLPEQLVPRAFVVLDALPLTVNGKLDRAALPRPDLDARADTDYISPRTDAEEIIAGAIATVLGVDQVGIDDNYFVLGGDSIRSVMVTSRAQARGVPVTVADLHARPTVRRLAEHLTTRQAQEAPAATEPFSLISAEDRALVPPDVEDAFPLNLLQEGMIFHRDFAAKSAVYHAIASIRLKAPYDHDVMYLVINQLVERHPMLRTSFDMTSFSQPLELVHSEFVCPLHMEDLRAQPRQAREARVKEWIADEKARGFELHEYPLIRFMVQRLTDEEWQFTYGFHHEIVDGWSEALMIAELFSHYFSVIYDEPIAIKAPTSTMRDAVALELEALRDKRNYEFWESYLADATMMRLPRFGAGLKADKGARDIVRIEVPVPVELSDKVKRLAVTHAVPLKNVLMAAHLVVMSTYGGHADTLTYTVGNGRPETADGSTAIGLFVNSLALRVPTPGGTWRELIEAGLESERASMPYRRLPMAELKRHQGSEPLAETLFFFTNYHVFGVLDQWTSRGVSHVATDLYGESTFPFCAINRLNRETGHLEIRLEYDALQFSAELMGGVRDCYAQVLTAMTEDPGGRYDTESFAPATDQRLFREVCWTPAAAADDRCLHELIEQRAAARPDAVAVQCEDALVSYRELNRRANRLAHLLRGHGARPERVVGVLAERSIGQLVALLGVLKAGAAYLPLDPSQPADRIAAVLADAGCDLVVTQRGLEDRLPSGVRAAAVEDAAGQPTTNPRTGVTPANAAYVIYTSGSTGQPKGVVVEHRNAVASTRARAAGYAEAPDRYLLLSSFAFDSSVAGIFWTLTHGGTLLLPAEGLQREPAALARLVASHRPSHTLGIPSLLKLLLDEASGAALDSLRVVISAGESCPAELADGYARRLPRATFHNEYGPTEGTVWASKWSSAPGGAPPPELLQVPIGRPVAGAHLVPVNHNGRVVPIGVTGELHLGGAGVARGYLGRPAETAASFRPDPYAVAPGARAYATGDLGRVLPEGVLEFQGRADHQVKVGGFRVELGAIEALLDAHPDIERSVVVATGEELGERALVGYVVPRAGRRVEPEAVRGYVRDKLPKYMLPAVVMVLDQVPLTATGKVDRAELPPVSHAQLAGGAEYVAPRNDIEAALAGIWCKVLELDRVGVSDSFFDIGGESLRAMQAMAATNKVFNTSLSVRRIFDAPTIGELAEELSRAMAEGAARPAAEPVGSPG